MDCRSGSTKERSSHHVRNHQQQHQKHHNNHLHLQQEDEVENEEDGQRADHSFYPMYQQQVSFFTGSCDYANPPPPGLPLHYGEHVLGMLGDGAAAGAMGAQSAFSPGGFRTAASLQAVLDQQQQQHRILSHQQAPYSPELSSSPPPEEDPLHLSFSLPSGSSSLYSVVPAHLQPAKTISFKKAAKQYNQYEEQSEAFGFETQKLRMQLSRKQQIQLAGIAGGVRKKSPRISFLGASMAAEDSSRCRQERSQTQQQDGGLVIASSPEGILPVQQATLLNGKDFTCSTGELSFKGKASLERRRQGAENGSSRFVEPKRRPEGFIELDNRLFKRPKPQDARGEPAQADTNPVNGENLGFPPSTPKLAALSDLQEARRKTIDARMANGETYEDAYAATEDMMSTASRSTDTTSAAQARKRHPLPPKPPPHLLAPDAPSLKDASSPPKRSPAANRASREPTAPIGSSKESTAVPAVPPQESNEQELTWSRKEDRAAKPDSEKSNLNAVSASASFSCSALNQASSTDGGVPSSQNGELEKNGSRLPVSQAQALEITTKGAPTVKANHVTVGNKENQSNCSPNQQEQNSNQDGRTTTEQHQCLNPTIQQEAVARKPPPRRDSGANDRPNLSGRSAVRYGNGAAARLPNPDLYRRRDRSPPNEFNEYYRGRPSCGSDRLQTRRFADNRPPVSPDRRGRSPNRSHGLPLYRRRSRSRSYSRGLGHYARVRSPSRRSPPFYARTRSRSRSWSPYVRRPRSRVWSPYAVRPRSRSWSRSPCGRRIPSRNRSRSAHRRPARSRSYERRPHSVSYDRWRDGQRGPPLREPPLPPSPKPYRRPQPTGQQSQLRPPDHLQQSRNQPSSPCASTTRRGLARFDATDKRPVGETEGRDRVRAANIVPCSRENAQVKLESIPLKTGDITVKKEDVGERWSAVVEGPLPTITGSRFDQPPVTESAACVLQPTVVLEPTVANGDESDDVNARDIGRMTEIALTHSVAVAGTGCIIVSESVAPAAVKTPSSPQATLETKELETKSGQDKRIVIQQQCPSTPETWVSSGLPQEESTCNDGTGGVQEQAQRPRGGREWIPEAGEPSSSVSISTQELPTVPGSERQMAVNADVWNQKTNDNLASKEPAAQEAMASLPTVSAKAGAEQPSVQNAGTPVRRASLTQNLEQRPSSNNLNTVEEESPTPILAPQPAETSILHQKGDRSLGTQDVGDVYGARALLKTASSAEHAISISPAAVGVQYTAQAVQPLSETTVEGAMTATHLAPMSRIPATQSPVIQSTLAQHSHFQHTPHMGYYISAPPQPYAMMTTGGASGLVFPTGPMYVMHSGQPLFVQPAPMAFTFDRVTNAVVPVNPGGSFPGQYYQPTMLGVPQPQVAHAAYPFTVSQQPPIPLQSNEPQYFHPPQSAATAPMAQDTSPTSAPRKPCAMEASTASAQTAMPVGLYSVMPLPIPELQEIVASCASSAGAVPAIHVPGSHSPCDLPSASVAVPTNPQVTFVPQYLVAAAPSTSGLPSFQGYTGLPVYRPGHQVSLQARIATAAISAPPDAGDHVRGQNSLAFPAGAALAPEGPGPGRAFTALLGAAACSSAAPAGAGASLASAAASAPDATSVCSMNYVNGLIGRLRTEAGGET